MAGKTAWRETETYILLLKMFLKHNLLVIREKSSDFSPLHFSADVPFRKKEKKVTTLKCTT